MTIQEATDLIRCDHTTSFTGNTWADLGCGSGIFTYALANLLRDGSTVYAIDKSIASFKKRPSPNNVIIKPLELNFENNTLPFNNLDGILMANSLHFVKDKQSFLENIKTFLNDNGIFLMVEYDMDISNYWVPYPVSFLSLQKLFADIGYAHVIRINEMPSRFNRGNLYAAAISH